MFSKGKYYPHYESDFVCRNSKYNGKQCYLCKICKYTFTDFTNSLSYNSKKSLDMWIKYVKYMVTWYSLTRRV